MATHKNLQRIIDYFEKISDEQKQIRMLISYGYNSDD